MNTARLGIIGAAMIIALSIAVAVAAAPLASHKPVAVQVQATLNGAGSDTEETNLGDLVADAIRQAGQADLAIVPADEIGSGSVPAGTVPISTIARALPYVNDADDTVIVLKLTGAQIREAIERSVSRAPQPFNGFLQVSGLQVRYDDSAADSKRVTALRGDAGDIAPAKTYTVATTRTIADGGLGYFQIWDKGDVASRTGISIADCLTSYLESRNTISGAVEARITKGR